MRLSILVGLCAVVLGLNRIGYCPPPQCEIDSNCYDSIHTPSLGSAKCCGGTCALLSNFPFDKLLGASCNENSGLFNNFESCGGGCANGLFCGGDKKCHVLLSAGCNCTDSTTCLSGNCANGQCVALPAGSYCSLGDQCLSLSCTPEGQCYGIPAGSVCNQGYQTCDTGLTCLYNATFYTTCQPLCQLGVAGCCNYDYDCVGGMASGGSPATTTCNGQTCTTIPGLGMACYGNGYGYCNNQTLLCYSSCNATVGLACSSSPVCQEPRSLALGAACQVDVQCPFNTTCTNAICTALYTVPLGGDCSSVLNCAPPGNICSQNPQGTRICKENGTTPVGSQCVNSYPSECVKGALCRQNASGVPVCSNPIPVGGSCLALRNYQTCSGDTYDYDYNPLCQSPTVGGACYSSTSGCTCVPPFQAPLGGNCSRAINCAQNASCVPIYFGYKTCVEPYVIPNGQGCNYTFQCKDLNAVCISGNKTCVNVAGLPCDSLIECNPPSDVNPGGVSYGSYPQWDCSCSRQCYLLNPVRPPTPPTPAPPPAPPTPVPCSRQYLAFVTAVPTYSSYYPDPGTFSRTSFHAQFVPALLTLTNATQALLIDLACCLNCPYYNPFYTYNVGGYQVNCATRTLSQVPANQCSLTAGALGMLNCWNAVGAASTASFQVGLLVAVLAHLIM